MKHNSHPVNVFVASTPLQLISCTEARACYCPEDPCLLIVARPDNAATYDQMEYLIDCFGWRNAEIVYLRKSTFYFRLGFVFNRLRQRHVARLFIGNKSSWIHEIFYLGLYWGDLIFVDDGIATVKYYHALHGEGLVSRISSDRRQLLLLLGIKLYRIIPDRVTFFTCFPLKSSERIHVETHDFPVFRRYFESPRQLEVGEPLVGFLGQPFAEEGSLKRLKMQIGHVVERHPGSHIVYFMHRKENRKALHEALQEFPVEIREAGKPIEVVVALSTIPFAAFYSFTSTALYTLKKIFPEMRIFQIDDPEMGAMVPFYMEIVKLFNDVGVEATVL